MTARSVVCPDCGAGIPYGRLSCPTCGSLLASVAGGARAARVVEEGPLATANEPDVPAEDAADEAASEADDAGRNVADDQAATERDPAAADDEAAAQGDVPAHPAVEAGTDAPSATDPEQVLPAPAPERPLAGRYLPPTVAFAAPVPEAAAAPARSRRPAATESRLPSDLPFDPPGDVAGWLVVAGSALASVSFLLPWAVLVIGGPLGEGYLDRWGLANPTSLVLLLACLATLGLGIVPNPLPVWLRTGVVPVVLGGILLGLVWAYVVGPYRPTIGVWTVFVGALLFVVGGLVALRPWGTPRHGDGEPPV